MCSITICPTTSSLRMLCFATITRRTMGRVYVISIRVSFLVTRSSTVFFLLILPNGATQHVYPRIVRRHARNPQMQDIRVANASEHNYNSSDDVQVQYPKYGPFFAQCFIVSSSYLGVIFRSDQPLAGSNLDPPFSLDGHFETLRMKVRACFLPGSVVFPPPCMRCIRLKVWSPPETAHENRGEPLKTGFRVDKMSSSASMSKFKCCG